MSENYKKYQSKMLSEISLGELMKLVDFIRLLSELAPEPNEIVDDALDLAQEVDAKIATFQIGEQCPRCSATLYLSDLPQYDSACYECDENF